ncbi:hypothetical protein AVEN_151986-1 [Araneus ventricosus]|uniref:Uncharacterized protein n=1 Tax=Araneus ventricosus TaxID=182803 RepID=A0A4Y2PPM2_ARAVE|nr:hypothetical protein AVEN_151986-1 [Araneus ventricosus]
MLKWEIFGARGENEERRKSKSRRQAKDPIRLKRFGHRRTVSPGYSLIDIGVPETVKFYLLFYSMIDSRSSNECFGVPHKNTLVLDKSGDGAGQELFHLVNLSWAKRSVEAIAHNHAEMGWIPAETLWRFEQQLERYQVILVISLPERCDTS